MEPLISVVVPIYKVEKYLPKCIESIIGQTYKNLEIILVDDGSPDNCGRICEQYAQKDPRIKVIHKENGGLSDARNAGIDVASGEYIGFVDSDDYIHCDMFKVLYNAIIRNNSDISVCDFKSVSEDEEVSISNSNYTNKIVLIDSEEKKIQYSLGEKYVIFTVAWNKLYRMSLFKDIRYPKGKIHEDEFTTYKLICMAGSVAYVNEAFYFYLTRSDSIMGQKFNEKSLHKLEAYTERLDYYMDRGLTNFWIRTMFFFKTTLVQMTDLISKSSDGKMYSIKKYKKYYNRQIRKHMGIILKDKGQKNSYLFYFLFPKLYMLVYNKRR